MSGKRTIPVAAIPALAAAPVLAVVLALGACTAGGPDGKGPTIAGLKVEPAPLESRPSEEAQRKRPGLISGADGEFTVYRKLDRGSADPDKPAKVKR